MADLKLDRLKTLTAELRSTNSRSEPEAQELLSDLEQYPRREFSSYYVPYLKDPDLQLAVIKLARLYPDNYLIQRDSVSTLGVLQWRDQYRVDRPKDEVFEFMKAATRIKKVNYYVSLYIFRFPQAADWQERWEYLLSIPSIAPKTKSFQHFYLELKEQLRSGAIIPEPILEQSIKLFEQQLQDEKLNKFTADTYHELLQELREKVSLL